jgi:hypothetical protein
VAPPGSLKIDPLNFSAFQEACAISVSIVLSTFAPSKVVHLNLATHMTPVCDCFGFTSMPVLPDAGIFGSDDIVAIDRAVLDVTANDRLLEENVPTCLEVHTRQGHPFRWLHGPLKDPYLVTEYGAQLGLGSREYELVDVLPVEKFGAPAGISRRGANERFVCRTAPGETAAGRNSHIGLSRPSAAGGAPLPGNRGGWTGSAALAPPPGGYRP